VLAVTLLAFTLRLVNLGGQSLWYDEAYQVLLARLPLPQLLDRVASDTNQPLSFLLLHLWGAADPAPDFYLRFPSVLAGALAVPLLWATGRLLLPARAAVAGALALAIAPFAVYYSQEARMYAAALALAAAAGYGFALGWRRERTAGWLLFTVAGVAALYTHVLAALPCFAPVAWALLRPRRHAGERRPLMLALAGVALGFAPGAAAVAAQAGTVATTFWAPTPHSVAPLLSLYQVLAGPFAGPALATAGLALLLLALGLTIPSLAPSRPQAGELSLLWLWTVLPVAALFALSFLRSVYIDRLLIGVSLPVCLLLGYTITSLRPRPIGVGLGMGLVSLAAWGLSAWYLNPAAGKPPYRAAARALVAAAHSSEPVLHTSDGSLLPFLVYAPGRNNLLLRGDPEHTAATSRANSTLVTQGITPVALEHAVAGHAAFWLVVSLDHSIDYQRETAGAFDARYQRTADYSVGGVVVRRYVR